MANISKVDAVNLLNGLLIDKINAQVAWGANNYPSGSLPGWFGGNVPNPLGRAHTGQDWCNGSIRAQAVNDTVSYVASISGVLCRKRIVIYFNGNGYNPPVQNVNNTAPWTTTQYDGNAIGYFSSGVGGTGTLVGAIPAGTSVEQADVSNLCNNMYNRWWSLAGGPVVGTLTNTVCHYSCHNNCHGNRGRR